MEITSEISISDWEITESFTRSGGPGGQNVNKVNTAVELRFEAARSPNLPEHVKARLKKLAGRRWTTEGTIVIHVSEERSQARNREIARDRLRDLIRKATLIPKKRKKTRVSFSQKRKRLDAKRRRAETKELRGKVDP